MQASEEQTIYDDIEAFTEAWNKGDAQQAASFYAEDSTRVGAFGDVQRGRAAIQAAYERLLRQTMPGAKLRQDRGEVRMVVPGVAVWQGGIEIVPPDGGAPTRGHVVQVMRKVDGRWLILEAHPKFFPSLPA